MPEFEKSTILQWLILKKSVSDQNNMKQSVFYKGCVDICPWKCIHYLVLIDDSINVEAPDESE